MSGGMRTTVIIRPLMHPAAVPTTSVRTAAEPIGKPPSRQSLPKTTAERPMSEPTERSIPPPTITGVSATARRPISTLSLKTSKALARVRKLVPMTPKTTISRSSKTMRICCDGSTMANREPVESPTEGFERTGADMSVPLPVESVEGDGHEDDQPLDGFLPLRPDLQEDQRRCDRAEQGHADQATDQR